MDSLLVISDAPEVVGDINSSKRSGYAGNSRGIVKTDRLADGLCRTGNLANPRC